MLDLMEHVPLTLCAFSVKSFLTGEMNKQAFWETNISQTFQEKK